MLVSLKDKVFVGGRAQLCFFGCRFCFMVMVVQELVCMLQKVVLTRQYHINGLLIIGFQLFQLNFLRNAWQLDLRINLINKLPKTGDLYETLHNLSYKVSETNLISIRSQLLFRFLVVGWKHRKFGGHSPQLLEWEGEGLAIVHQFYYVGIWS